MMDNNKCYVDGTLKLTHTAGTFTSSELQLFASHQGGTGSNLGNYATYKLYGCQIWQNGNLVRDYIPVSRKSDNIGGLLDVVNNKFYASNGTAQFTKGSVRQFQVKL